MCLYLLLQTALEQGADVVIQSTHKTLAGLTQSSMLHVRGGLIEHSRISSALEILQVGCLCHTISCILQGTSTFMPGAVDLASQVIADFVCFIQCSTRLALPPL